MPETHDAQPEPPPQQGISLDKLSEAFAQAMRLKPEAERQTDLAAETEATPQPAGPTEILLETVQATDKDRTDRDEGPFDDEKAGDYEETTNDERTADDEDRSEIGPQTIVEAMLFVGNDANEPLPAARMAELMRDVEPEEVVTLIDRLNQRYTAAGCPYFIAHEGSGYRMTLRGAFHTLRNRLYGRVREARLSQAAIDVLAIVAYKQPLTGEDIGQLRGKPSGHLLSQLVRRGLLRIERKQDQRRVAWYHTTDRFLAFFRLESLDDLPRSEDLDR